MCGMIGYTSAQTPSESSQDSSNHAAAATTVAGIIEGLAAGNYRAVHVWKPTAPGSPTHHSHIQIRDDRGADLFHFGLFADGGIARIMGGPGTAPSRNGYAESDSYRPNPAQVTDVQIATAYTRALNACGGKYRLLHNNCQKFARKFMTALGVKHYRKLFHP